MALMKCPECGKEISDRATSCPNCGCPILISTDNSTQIPDRNQVEKTKADKKKTITIAGSIIAIVAIIVVVYVFAVAQPKKLAAETKATYTEAIALLEKGKYSDGIELLNTIPDYEGVSNILEEAKYESYAYAAVNAVKGVLKNPDSISVYDLYFYEPAGNKDSTAEGEPKFTHPIVIMYFGAQNGFGGNTTGYASCAYDKDKNDYVLACFTDELDVEDLDEDDDDYLYQYISATVINDYFDTGKEVGVFDKARFDTVLKNAAYSAIKIID